MVKGLARISTNEHRDRSGLEICGRSLTSGGAFFMPLSRALNILDWLLRIAVAVILLQTLFFKFTGAKESVYIFTTLGAEPWGRIGSGRPVVRFKRCRIFMILVLQICFR